MVNQSTVNYTCNDWFAHTKGSLIGSCKCSSTSDGNCINEPDWYFPEGLPQCVGKLWQLLISELYKFIAAVMLTVCKGSVKCVTMAREIFGSL